MSGRRRAGELVNCSCVRQHFSVTQESSSHISPFFFSGLLKERASANTHLQSLQMHIYSYCWHCGAFIILYKLIGLFGWFRDRRKAVQSNDYDIKSCLVEQFSGDLSSLGSVWERHC